MTEQVDGSERHDRNDDVETRLPVQKRAEDTVQQILEAGGDGGPGLVPGFEVSPIFNFHVGPGQKIKVRGRAADQSRQEVR